MWTNIRPSMQDHASGLQLPPKLHQIPATRSGHKNGHNIWKDVETECEHEQSQNQHQSFNSSFLEIMFDDPCKQSTDIILSQTGEKMKTNLDLSLSSDCQKMLRYYRNQCGCSAKWALEDIRHSLRTVFVHVFPDADITISDVIFRPNMNNDSFYKIHFTSIDSNTLQKITILGSNIERTFFHLDDDKISIDIKDTLFIGSGLIIDPDVDNNSNKNTDNTQTVTIETSAFEGQFHLSTVNVRNAAKVSIEYTKFQVSDLDPVADDLLVFKNVKLEIYSTNFENCFTEIQCRNRDLISAEECDVTLENLTVSHNHRLRGIYLYACSLHMDASSFSYNNGDCALWMDSSQGTVINTSFKNQSLARHVIVTNGKLNIQNSAFRNNAVKSEKLISSESSMVELRNITIAGNSSEFLVSERSTLSLNNVSMTTTNSARLLRDSGSTVDVSF